MGWAPFTCWQRGAAVGPPWQPCPPPGTSTARFMAAELLLLGCPQPVSGKR